MEENNQQMAMATVIRVSCLRNSATIPRGTLCIQSYGQTRHKSLAIPPATDPEYRIQ